MCVIARLAVASFGLVAFSVAMGSQLTAQQSGNELTATCNVLPIKILGRDGRKPIEEFAVDAAEHGQSPTQVIKAFSGHGTLR